MCEKTKQPLFTRDQVRAQYAWEFVEKKLNGWVGPKDFAKACKNASSRIMNAGLGGALAFTISKAGTENTEKKKYDRVAAALAGHLGRKPEEKATPRTYLAELIKLDAMTLRADTDEAMAVLQWLARIADGKAREIGDKGSSDE
jgi:CRISPR type III-B/RAMP module-associated protein Cmr5